MPLPSVYRGMWGASWKGAKSSLPYSFLFHALFKLIFFLALSSWRFHSVLLNIIAFYEVGKNRGATFCLLCWDFLTDK